MAGRQSGLTAIGAAVIAMVVASASSGQQTPTIRAVDEGTLQEYSGVYSWEPDAFVYLQLWDEFSGFGKPRQLVAFDESGDVRTLYPSDRDRFFAGPGMAVASAIESTVEFQRDRTGRITGLTWQRAGSRPRSARRVEIERREDVRFANGTIQLAGVLTRPATAGRHPAIILVHGSGAENRDYMLPWARFLVRRGIAVLGYDKRGVGQSTGDWNTASFQDLAADVGAAFTYLKGRPDIDPSRIGLFGISQAGWIMPLAAIQAKDLAFMISISGAGVPPAETTLDQARNEMSMTGMPPPLVEAIIGVLKLQYEFARTGRGWDEYAAARQALVSQLGAPPDTIPGSPDAPYFDVIRRTYFFDPAPVLRQLQTRTLAIWGALDNNILADKNRSTWDSALKAAGNQDYTLITLPGANHAQWEAKVGSNAEMKSLQRFVPAYFTTIQDWLTKRGFLRPGAAGH